MKQDENGQDVAVHYQYYTLFRVFNAEQCHSGEIEKYLVKPENASLYEINYDKIDEVIQRLQIPIHYTDTKAYYRPNNSEIYMPARGHFNSVGDYYCTLAHEMCHWGEHKAGIRGKHADYADHELSAEIGASFLLRELGAPLVETERLLNNSAVYLKSWLGKMQKDSKYIFTAATRAAKIVDFLLNRKDENNVEVESSV
jgi:antirestriction protein ArdC